jgi:lysozyme family protein
VFADEGSYRSKTPMIDLNTLKAGNARRWLSVRITRDATAPARRLLAARPRYQAVAAKTGVPWFAIAVIHEREALQRWDTQLGQGDPLHSVSVHVPAGRGPFATWEEGAYDALVNCAPHAARWSDWSIGGLLILLEQYNGLGYAAKGRPSLYVWAGTDQYVSGKYVRDGVFDPAVVDRQLGCAGLLLAMMARDPSIEFGAAASPPPVSTWPSLAHPSPGSLGAFIASVIAAIFKRK